LEESEKVLIDPFLEGKSREEMRLEPFVDTEIRSSIVGVPVFTNQEIIAYVIGRASESNFKDGLDNNKKSPWNEIVNVRFIQQSFYGEEDDAEDTEREPAAQGRRF